MKLDDIRKLTSMGIPQSPESQQTLHEFLLSVGIDPGSVYQELEMSSQFVNTHRDITYSGQIVSLHSHTYLEILYCHTGANVEYLVGSDRYKLQKGDIILLAPGVSHRPIMPEIMAEPYIRDVLWVNPDFLTSLENVFPRTSVSNQNRSALIRTQGTKWAFLGELFQAGVQEEEQKKDGWEAIVLGNTLKILTYLDRACNDRDAGILKAEKPELLDKMTAYIEEHYAEHITISDLAHKFYVSSSSISHLFKQKMGLSIYQYVTQRRLISAKNLICGGTPLEHVAPHVGFVDYSTFYRASSRSTASPPGSTAVCRKTASKHKSAPIGRTHMGIYTVLKISFPP